MDILKYLIPRNLNNWSVVNTPNYYNFIIVTYDLLDNDKQLMFVNNIKLILGLTFTMDLKLYLFKKSPQHELLKLI